MATGEQTKKDPIERVFSGSVWRRVWRSVIRHGFPDTNRNRALAVFTNFFLHMHPVKARVRIYGQGGELLWSAREDDAGQRRLNANFHEVLWRGVNHAGVAVGSGVYVYTITSATGVHMGKDKVAVVW